MTYKTLRESVAGVLTRIFIEREVFLRTDGRVRYLRVSRSRQTTLAVLGFVAAAWVAYASVSVILHNQIVAGKVREIERHKLAYLDLLTEASEHHDQFTQITRNLEDNQSYLLDLLARGAQSPDDLAGVEGQLKGSQTERARVALARDVLGERLTHFEAELSQFVEGDPNLRQEMGQVAQALGSGEAAREQVAAAREQVGERLQQVEAELAEVAHSKSLLEAILADLSERLNLSRDAGPDLVDDEGALQPNGDALEPGPAGDKHTSLQDRINALQLSLGMAERRHRLERRRSSFEDRIAGLEDRLVGMRETQQTMVDRLSERTTLGIDGFEQTIARTGLDINSLLSGAGSAGADQGGPFIPGDYLAEEDPIASLQSSIAMVDGQMDRWQQLRELMQSVPLIAPLDQFRITSTFGVRRDPVNRRKSVHYGLDLGAPIHTPIMATAPGKVVYAGWKGRYGRTIVIDHGRGIRTRYAHLRKILVKRGQRVGHREKIALLGSSGRSTGPHVHYEVQFRGKPLDPLKFLKAGKHAFEG